MERIAQILAESRNKILLNNDILNMNLPKTTQEEYSKGSWLYDQFHHDMWFNNTLDWWRRLNKLKRNKIILKSFTNGLWTFVKVGPPHCAHYLNCRFRRWNEVPGRVFAVAVIDL